MQHTVWSIYLSIYLSIICGWHSVAPAHHRGGGGRSEVVMMYDQAHLTALPVLLCLWKHCPSWCHVCSVCIIHSVFHSRNRISKSKFRLVHYILSEGEAAFLTALHIYVCVCVCCVSMPVLCFDHHGCPLISGWTSINMFRRPLLFRLDLFATDAKRIESSSVFNHCQYKHT